MQNRRVFDHDSFTSQIPVQMQTAVSWSEILADGWMEIAKDLFLIHFTSVGGPPKLHGASPHGWSLRWRFTSAAR